MHEKEIQSGLSLIPPMFMSLFWLLSFLLSVFSAWVSWSIDVKHVHTLHTGILHHSPSLPDTCKGQPETQPKEVNSIAGIITFTICMY